MGSLLSSSPISTILVGDCVEEMAKMPADSVDSIVTDPPYGLTFMGRGWDKLGHGNSQQAWHALWAREAFRVLKPGGFAVVAGGTRTFHRLVCALEDAGFEIRDTISHIYGSGFPKSKSMKDIGRPELGTALKPAFEPWTLARKPLSEKNVAQNVLKHGTGAINVDGCRIQHASPSDLSTSLGKNPGREDMVTSGVYGKDRPQQQVNTSGRWPPNLLLSHHSGCNGECVEGCPVAEMDRQGGSKSASFQQARTGNNTSGWGLDDNGEPFGYTDQGGASRFFPRFEAELEAPFRYVAKASRRERNAGLPDGETSGHPTVKPIALMRWLVRLVTSPGGTVLDPFMGSGSTGCAVGQEGFDFIGIEMDEEYAEIARRRIAYWSGNIPAASTEVVDAADPTDPTFIGRLF